MITLLKIENTACNKRFAAMLADETQHQLSVLLSAVVPA
jgi:hypothetical protein